MLTKSVPACRTTRIFSALLLALVWCCPPESQAQTHYFPKATNSTSLVVISEGNLGNNAQRVMIATLQGLVARRSSEQIYIDGGSGYTLWKNHLRDRYGIAYITTADPWFLVNRYKGLLDGYLLYDIAANTNSVNAATSLCGLSNAIAVDVSLEAQVLLRGITNRLADLRTRDEGWVWTNYNSVLNRSNVVEQRESIAHHLRDYATLANAFTFFDGNSPWRNTIVSGLQTDAACLGWGDASQGEDRFVGNSSSNGVFTLPADWALNLSSLSGIRDDSLQQRTYTNPPTSTNVHYVTFIVTDGDNVQWNLGGFPAYFNQPARGGFPMGWALSPALADLAPSVLRWYYESASNQLHRDFFVAGPSGSGYLYPSRYPPAELDLHVQKLSLLTSAADLSHVQILDFNSFNRLDLWNKYLRQPNLDGLFYLEYAPYNGAAGAILFATNGKPVIAAREMLWGGLQEEASVITNLNAAPRDPSSPAGYSFVTVHVWSKSLANIRTVVTNLLPDVRVVTPDAFVKLVRSNIGRRLSFDFATGLQGWSGKISGKFYDKAEWTSSEGAGALLLDGSDLGNSDANPNSWFTRQIALPVNAHTLSYDTRAINDGRLRVRVLRPDGIFITVQNWDSPTNQNWVTRLASLTNFAGQTVTLYFEQNDGGQGNGEYRFVDNIQVLTTGPAVYQPAAPKLLAASASPTNGVALEWRDNDSNEFQFLIERKVLPGGAWSQIAIVASNLTSYTDWMPPAGTNVAYRLRASNAAGPGPYSNERQVLTWPRPKLAGQFSSSVATLNWPAWASNFALHTATQLQATVWTRITNNPTNSPAGLTVTLPLESGTGQSFFRLQLF